MQHHLVVYKDFINYAHMLKGTPLERLILFIYWEIEKHLFVEIHRPYSPAIWYVT